MFVRQNLLLLFTIFVSNSIENFYPASPSILFWNVPRSNITRVFDFRWKKKLFVTLYNVNRWSFLTLSHSRLNLDSLHFISNVHYHIDETLVKWASSLSRSRFVLHYRYRKSIEVTRIQLAKALKPRIGSREREREREEQRSLLSLLATVVVVVIFFAFYPATKFPYCVAFEKRRPAEKRYYVNGWWGKKLKPTAFCSEQR